MKTVCSSASGLFVYRLLFGLLGGLLFVVTPLGNVLAETSTLYLETFPRTADETSTYSGQISGWKGIKGGRSIGVSTVLKVHPPGAPGKRKPVNSYPLGKENGHAFWGQPSQSGVILYTTEISMSVRQLRRVSYDQRLSGYNKRSGGWDGTRLALLIGRNWYISDMIARQSDRGAWKSVEFADIRNLTFGTSRHRPCSAPKAPGNSGLYLPNEGIIEAIGVIMDSVHGRVRLDNFAIAGVNSGVGTGISNMPGRDDCPLGVWSSLYAFDPYAQEADRDECPLESRDSCDLDTDEDGLSDWHEKVLGTDPRKADTDGDGILDGDEHALGSSPLDKGSRVRAEEITSCLPWNTYFGMWNIAEHSAALGVPFATTSKVVDLSGADVSRLRFRLSPFEQRDIMLHEMVKLGEVGESYGLVCSTSDGRPGSLRTTMVQYKPSASPERAFQFAFGNQDSTGRTGTQIVPFNTYPPSISADTGNQWVANWLSVINLASPGDKVGKKVDRAKVRFYDDRGKLLGEDRVSLGGGERRDIAGGHQFGSQKIGIAEFIPDDAKTFYQVNISRYVMGGADYKAENVLAAVQIPAMLGSGQKQLLPIDSQKGSMNVIELFNSSDKAIVAELKIFNLQNRLKSRSKEKILPKATVHIIASDILRGQRGFAVAKSNSVGSLSAVSMHYQRSSDGNIYSMFGVPAQEPLGYLHLMSFNSYLGQENELWGVSIAKAPLKANLRTRHYSGEMLSSSLQLPAKGALAYTVKVPADTYGTVAVTAPPRQTAWWLLRKHRDFVIPLAGN